MIHCRESFRCFLFCLVNDFLDFIGVGQDIVVLVGEYITRGICLFGFLILFGFFFLEKTAFICVLVLRYCLWGCGVFDMSPSGWMV